MYFIFFKRIALIKTLEISCKVSRDFFFFFVLILQLPADFEIITFPFESVTVKNVLFVLFLKNK
jgi:hypothetical protein